MKISLKRKIYIPSLLDFISVAPGVSRLQKHPVQSFTPFTPRRAFLIPEKTTAIARLRLRGCSFEIRIYNNSQKHANIVPTNKSN